MFALVLSIIIACGITPAGSRVCAATPSLLAQVQIDLKARVDCSVDQAWCARGLCCAGIPEDGGTCVYPEEPGSCEASRPYLVLCSGEWVEVEPFVFACDE
jgi:hypothetical protein